MKAYTRKQVDLALYSHVEVTIVNEDPTAIEWRGKEETFIGWLIPSPWEDKRRYLVLCDDGKTQVILPKHIIKSIKLTISGYTIPKGAW